MTTEIKICGITRIVDAQVAIEAGAKYLGLIFAEESPRKLSRAAAAEIVRLAAGRVKLVGVFKNQPAQYVAGIAGELSLDYVQCHGQESPQYCQDLPVPAIKSFELTPGFNLTALNPYRDCVFAILLDRPKSSGEVNWLAWAVEFSRSYPSDLPPLFFAGGLTAENLEAVLSLPVVYAVDVASGVEAEPGIKDAQKIRQFCETVQRYAKTADNVLEPLLKA